jgi:hypothetical protein
VGDGIGHERHAVDGAFYGTTQRKFPLVMMIRG